jgi:hypothetical protein
MGMQPLSFLSLYLSAGMDLGISVKLESALRELPPDYFLQKLNLLSQLLGFARQLETISECLVR